MTDPGHKMSRKQRNAIEKFGFIKDAHSNGEDRISTQEISPESTINLQRGRSRSHSLHPNSHYNRDIGYVSGQYTRRKSLSSYDLGHSSDHLTVPMEDSEIEAKQDIDRNIQIMELMKSCDDSSLRRVRSFRDRPERSGEGLRRVRSFKTTSKGLVNRGDSFKIKRDACISPLGAQGGAQDLEDNTLKPSSNLVIPQLITTKSEDQHRYFRVLITGAQGVGKSSIIDQFMTSEFLGCGDYNISQSDGDRTVTLQVDGEESTLEFLQSEDFQEDDEGFQIDGFVVVYCITERETFDIAIDLMKQIREEVGANKAIILVGNKSDLVRKRTISQEEGRSAADAYGSKYIELSAVLNHKVDELLVGIHKQIMLKHDADGDDIDQNTSKPKERKSSFKRTKRFLEKVFLGHSGKDKKTENLYVD